MPIKKVIITAGLDRALHAVALAELCRRNQIEVTKFLVVKATGMTRIKTAFRQHGWKYFYKAIKRMMGLDQSLQEFALIRAFLQENNITVTSLKKWAKEFNTEYYAVSSLNDPRAIAHIANAADVVIYAGGGILKKPFIDAAQGKILNAHSGMLPDIRGMQACEWSILLGKPLTVTIHAIDEGIDTGKIFKQMKIDWHINDTLDTLRENVPLQGFMVY